MVLCNLKPKTFYDYIFVKVAWRNISWVYLDEWESIVMAREGFSPAEKKTMLLSQETRQLPTPTAVDALAAANNILEWSSHACSKQL